MLIVILLSLLWKSVTAADGVLISNPKSGDALQGLVIISGSTEVSGFQVAEMAFNFPGGNPQSWFLIQQSKTPVKDGVLAVWDTTTIADGVYRLRIRVTLPEGRFVEEVVENLRVRNYTPIETSIPATTIGDAPTATRAAYTTTPRSTPSPFPANPLQLQPVQIQFSIVEGVAAALVGLTLLGVYVRAKRRR